MNDSKSFPKLFFSYGHDENTELVDKFKKGLEESGYKVWMDYDGIGTWEDWRGKIVEGILNHDLAIVYLSEHSTRDSAANVCLNEIALILDKPMKIKPILVESMDKVKPPITISHIQFLDLSEWRKIGNGKIEGEAFDGWYKEKLAEIIKGIEKDKEFSGDIEVLKEVLKPLAFQSDIARHIKYFTGREWVFSKYDEWLKDFNSRLLWITAGPGFGKTAVAANLVNNHPDAIIGALFCQRGSSNPVELLMTISFQIAYRLEDYRAKLMKSLGISASIDIESIKSIRDELIKIGEKSTYDLFRKLLKEPLQELIGNGKKYVIVIDALDEVSDKEGNNPIAELIAHEFAELSENLSFIVTSRPDPSVVIQMQGYNPFRIDGASFKEDNVKDLINYIENSLKRLIVKGKINSLSKTELKDITDILIEKSEGMVLYLKLVFEGIKEGTLDINRLGDTLKGLYALYASQFGKKFTDEQYKNLIRPLLRIIITSLGPIPEELLYQILKRQITDFNKEKFVECVNLLGSYIASSDEGLKVFHKSLTDWLTTNTKDSPNKYFIDSEEGMAEIAEYLVEDFERGNPDNLYQEIKWQKQVKEWLPNFIESLSSAWNNNPNLLNNFGLFLAMYSNNNDALKIFNRAIRIREKFRENMGIRFNADMADGLAATYMNKGNCLRQLGNNNKAVIEFEKAILIREELRENTGERFTFDMADSLAETYTHKGDALAVMGNNNKAVIEFEKAILIREELRENMGERFTFDKADGLAKAYTNKGNALQVMGNNNKALIEFEKAIKIWEQVQKMIGKDFNPYMSINLAKTYNNEGIALRNIGENEKALAEYEKAIGIWKKLTKELGEGFIPDMAHNLGIVYNNKGVALRNIGENEKALAEYEKAIGIWKKLTKELGEGFITPYMSNNLAKTTTNKGIALFNIGATNKAVIELEKAIGMLKKLTNELEERRTPGMSNGLAIAFANKGVALQNIGENEKALVEYENAIEIWEQVQMLLGKGFNPYMSNNLAKTTTNKGIALFNIGANNEAVIEFEKAIDIWEKLAKEFGEGFTPDIVNGLLKVYKNDGIVLQVNADNNGDTKEYNKADEILDNLQKKLGFKFWENSEKLLLSENELLSCIEK